MQINFPQPLHVLDAGHPECLDWRRVSFSIHQHLQNVTLSFRLRRKAGGRSISELARCRQFWGELDRIVEKFFRLTDPVFNRQDDPYHLLFTHTVGCGFANDGKHSPVMSFTFRGDVLPNFIELSNHRKILAQQHFIEIAEQAARRRDRSIRK